MPRAPGRRPRLGLVALSAVAVVAAGVGVTRRALARAETAILDGLAAEGLASRPDDLAQAGDLDRRRAWLDLGDRCAREPWSVRCLGRGPRHRIAEALADPDAADRLVGFQADPQDPRCPGTFAGAVERLERLAGELEPEVDALLDTPWTLGFDPRNHDADARRLPWVTLALNDTFRFRALHRSVRGDQAGAWRDVLRLARIAARLDAPTDVYGGLRRIVGSQACRAARDLLAAHGPPPRAQRELLVPAFEALDEAESHVRGLRGELAVFVAGAALPPNFDGWEVDEVARPSALRAAWQRTPMWRLQLTAQLAHEVRRARDLRDRPRAALAELEPGRPAPGAPTDALARLLAQSGEYGRSWVPEHRARVRLVLAGLRLGQGLGPDAAPALVDPLDPQGQPLRRVDLPDGRVRLWSVGPDLTDQGGVGPRPGRPYDAKDHDLVFEVAPPAVDEAPGRGRRPVRR